MQSQSQSQSTKQPLPSTAPIVIIGGGVMGCGLAYHLAHEGVSDTVLLEKGELTSGSTWHAAGQITHATSSFSLLQCIKYNLELYAALEAETGQSVTMHNCGSLRMVYNKDELDWQKHILSVIKNFDLPGEIISPAEIKALHPFYNTDGIIAALHTPHDGHLDPAGLSFALAKGARQKGVNIFTHCRAVSVEKMGDEWLVHTEKGDICCQHVVNAGGTYARQMALELGYDLPTTSMTHHYFVTEQIPEFAALDKELPVVRDDRVVSGYLRMEQKSGLIGIYEKSNTNHVWENGTPWESEHELFEPDYDRIAPWLEKALERFPILGTVGIKRAVHGAISHPPDGNPLIGPVPGLSNYWACCGIQIGIGWGPGLTRELAKWMVHGSADINMRAFDPRRFGQYANQSYQVKKAHEDYSLRHEIPFTHFSRVAERPIKKSALYEVLKEKGAVFEEIHGWERPRWFAPQGTAAEDIYSFSRNDTLHSIVSNEANAVRNGAGIIDFSAFCKVMVSGADSAAFINRITPSRLPAVGKIILAHLLCKNGRVDIEVSISRLDEQTFYLVCASVFEEQIIDKLNELTYPTESININNLTSAWGTIALTGPKSRDILSAVTTHALDNVNFPWLSGKEITVDDYSIWAFRLSYAGELGWELHAPHDYILHCYNKLFEAGQQYNLRDYGTFAMNSLRMEKAYIGISELTSEVTLDEAQVMNHVDMNKEHFYAKEAVKESLSNLRWKCVYLEIEDDGKNDGNGNEAILSNGKRVGSITSIAYGHTTHKLLAFAYIHPDYTEVGTPLTVMIMNEERAATILPFAVYDVKSEKPRG